FKLIHVDDLVAMARLERGCGHAAGRERLRLPDEGRRHPRRCPLVELQGVRRGKGAAVSQGRSARLLLRRLALNGLAWGRPSGGRSRLHGRQRHGGWPEGLESGGAAGREAVSTQAPPPGPVFGHSRLLCTTLRLITISDFGQV